MFMHGEQNQRLSYLPLLRREGVQVEEVPLCGCMSRSAATDTAGQPY
jgi:hypothetical protein